MFSGKGAAGLSIPHPMPNPLIAATGMYVPERILASAELEADLGLPPGWIVKRCGVAERRLAAPEEATSDLAAAAARQALTAASLPPDDLDALILCTSTPDHPLPPTAPLVLARLGCRRAFGFDLAAACSGFIYGLSVAEQYVRTGRYRHVLVVGANVMSRRVDWRDRDTCILFGDGAGAVLVQAGNGGRSGERSGSGQARGSAQPGSAGRGIIHTRLKTDGSAYELLMVPGGGSREPLSPEGLQFGRDRMRMKGSLLYRHAVRAMAGALEEALAASGLDMAGIDRLIPHQANRRLIDALIETLDLPPGRAVVNIDRYGNTSAASIPMALHEAAAAGLIRRGDLVALVAFGGGLTSGAALLRW